MWIPAPFPVRNHSNYTFSLPGTVIHSLVEGDSGAGAGAIAAVTLTFLTLIDMPGRSSVF
jgi:hypothetical protein